MASPDLEAMNAEHRALRRQQTQHEMDQFERFRLEPWVGYVVAGMLMLGAWNRNGAWWAAIRGSALTLFFASQFVALRRRRIPRDARPSGWEWRAAGFAALCALLTLFALIAGLLDTW